MRAFGKVVIAVVSLFPLLGVAQDAPKTMTKIVVQADGPDLPQDSFARKPKTIYRAGNSYCRIEEMPDPEHGIHGLTIISEPDIWMVNLATKTAQHLVDGGPTYNCRLPIFLGPVAGTADNVNYVQLRLEFGHELEFFKKTGAIRQDPGPVLQNQRTVGYVIDMGSTRLALYTYGPNDFPLLVGRTYDKKGELIWYSGYGQVPFDPKIFAKPDGVSIVEAKH